MLNTNSSFDTQVMSLQQLSDQPHWIAAKRLELVYENSMLSLTAGVFCAFILVLLLWSVVDSRGLIMWLGTISVLTMFRLALQQRYERSRHDPDPAHEPTYRRAFLISVVLSGGVWGALSVWLFPMESMIHQAYFTFVLGGVCASAVSAYAPLPSAFPHFAIPALLPFAMRIWASGTTEGKLLAAVIAALLLIFLRTSRASRKTVNDILELQIKNAKLTRALHHRATHDSLVDLVNHGEFNRRLEKLARDMSGESKEYSLIFVDLDLFKAVNDSGGHAAGDALLRAIAGILRKRTRSSDTAARVGGDEFALLLEGCPHARAEDIAEQIRIDIAEMRVDFEGMTHRVEASVGVSFGKTGIHSATGMLKAADAACYAAKEEGRNCVRTNAASDMYQTTDRFDLIHPVPGRA